MLHHDALTPQAFDVVVGRPIAGRLGPAVRLLAVDPPRPPLDRKAVVEVRCDSISQTVEGAVVQGQVDHRSLGLQLGSDVLTHPLVVRRIRHLHHWPGLPDRTHNGAVGGFS